MRKMALTVPCERTGRTGIPAQAGNCSLTNRATVVAETSIWFACIGLAGGMRRSLGPWLGPRPPDLRPRTGSRV
ncbi:hypothetical protein GCM10009826_20470 [Humibacillus xanthopallidus]